MSDGRDWGKARQARSQQSESEQLELLMRSILKLFADGCLVYRDRTQSSAPVLTKSDRLKRLRRGLVPDERAVA